MPPTRPTPPGSERQKRAWWLRRPTSPPPGARETQLDSEPSTVKRGWKLLGPGFLSGCSDDDPTAIATYSVAGAQFGYATAWTPILTFPMMATVQYLCSKIGLCSGRGLAGVIKQRYSKGLLYPIVGGLLIANTINAGADIGAIAAAINLLVPIPAAWLIVPVAAILLALQVWGSYRLVERIFKGLALFLVAYLGAVVLARPHWPSVLHDTLVPTLRFDKTYLSALVAIFGGNISPYLFFWQASLEIEERKALGEVRLWQRRGASQRELTYAAWDVGIGMLFSNLVIWAINISTAATLFLAGRHDINTAADAAAALRPFAGNWAYWLFAIGMIGSGALAVPTLTSSSAFALADTFDWREGLEEKPWRAPRFYLVIAASTLVAIGINYLGINPIAALYWSAVINGLLAPPMLLVIMHITNDAELMGARKNGRLSNVMGWLTTLTMVAAAFGLFWSWR